MLTLTDLNFVLAGSKLCASRNYCASSIFCASANFCASSKFCASSNFCFAALSSKSTTMAIARQSAHLITPFLGKLEEAVNQYFVMGAQ